MTRVILSPTWKLIPGTVSWPEKPVENDDGEYIIDESCPNCGHEYDEIDEEYQTCSHCKFDNTYEGKLTEASRHLVDIEEEDWETVRILSVNERGITASYSKLTQLKNGAWQVKPDTVYSIDAEFEVGLEVCIDCPSPKHCQEGCSKKIARLVKPKEQTEAEKLADIPWKPQPTETQDELWEEIAQSIITHVQVMPELKKRFRIERI